MGVDHRCRDVVVTQKLVDGPGVLAAFQQVRPEQVAYGVAVCWLGNAAAADGLLHGPLQGGFEDVVTFGLSRIRIDRSLRRREEVLAHPPRREASEKACGMTFVGHLLKQRGTVPMQKVYILGKALQMFHPKPTVA